MDRAQYARTCTVAQILTLPEAIEALVHDGDCVAMEGFTHLIPFAAGHEIIRQGRRDLTLVRLTPDVLFDQMTGEGCASKLVFSWGGNPGVGSLHRLRDAIENDWPRPLEIDEHSHAGLTNRYVAGASGATPFGAAAAAPCRMLAEWWHSGKRSVLGGISGAVAGLVAITPASGFVQPFSALAIGFLAGMVCYFMVVKVKRWFGYDDALDAFGVHGMGGTLGAILTGVFATSAINSGLKDSGGHVLPLGLVDGKASQVLNQMIGCGIAWAIAVVGTLVILKVCDVLIGLRISPEQEREGLDLSQHGEEGYIFES